MALAAKIKPARDYPNMNAMQAVRGTWEVSPATTDVARLPFARGQWQAIGHIAANSMITLASLHIATGALAAGATIDVACGENGPTDAIVAGASLDAAGNTSVTVTAGLGYRPARSIVYAKITSAADLTAGKFSVLVQYYSKQD